MDSLNIELDSELLVQAEEVCAEMASRSKTPS